MKAAKESVTTEEMKAKLEVRGVATPPPRALLRAASIDRGCERPDVCVRGCDCRGPPRAADSLFLHLLPPAQTKMSTASSKHETLMKQRVERCVSRMLPAARAARAGGGHSPAALHTSPTHFPSLTLSHPQRRGGCGQGQDAGSSREARRRSMYGGSGEGELRMMPLCGVVDSLFSDCVHAPYCNLHAQPPTH